MAKIYKRECDFCKKPYKGFGRYYCSFSCRAKGDRKVAEYAKKGRKIRWEKAERGKLVKCKFCGKEKWEYPYKLKKGGNFFCSRKCANLFNAEGLSKKRMGKGNPRYGKRPWNYIDGERCHYYARGKWRRFAEKIRNGNKCKICGGMKDLVVHHIISRRLGGKDNIENLMVLCRKCHSRLHAEMARGGDA